MCSRLRDIRRDGGASLLEMIVYAAVLAVVVNLATGVFITSLRLGAFGGAALDTTHTTRELQRAFTDAVRASAGVASRLGDHQSSNTCLVLRMPPGPDATERYVVFGAFVQPDRLGKLAVAANNGAYAADSFVTYPREFESLRFSYDAPNPEEARRITLEIHPKQQTKADEPRTKRFVASPRSIMPES